MASKRKITFLLILLFIAIIVGTASYLLYSRQISVTPTPTETKEYPKKPEIGHGDCLQDNEFAEYKIDKKESEVSQATIFIKDKGSKEELFSFRVEMPIPEHYHPIELHNCGVYATKSFYYDYKKRQALPNYRIELWRYRYSGQGESLLFLSGPISGTGFSPDFRIDPTETYIALVKSWVGDPQYAIIIKNLKTMEDAVSWKLKDLIEKYQIEPGIFTLSGWDDRRFGFQINNNELPVFNIEKETWELKKIF